MDATVLLGQRRIGADDGPGAPSTTVRSSPAAWTAKFSAKNRASAMREAPSAPSRSAASACCANMQPPVVMPNSRR